MNRAGGGGPVFCVESNLLGQEQRPIGQILARQRAEAGGIIEKVERAIQLSIDKYCSASAMLAKTADITHDFEIVED